MKKRMIQKLLTSTAALLACTLLLGNMIPPTTPTMEEGDSVVIELPSSDDFDEDAGYAPLCDDEPLGDEDE